MTRTPLSRSKGHQATLLRAALTCEAGAAVTMRTNWAWETTATLHLLGGVQGTGAPTGRRGAGAYHVTMHTACYPRRAHSALGVDTVLTLDVCLYVCMLVL